MKGRCMCGAVTFEVQPKKMEFGACHCGMCRAWTGSAFVGVNIPPGGFTATGGAEAIRTFRSSDWAERGWCDTCGSSLFYRITADGPHGGVMSVALGALEDPDALTFTHEIFIDRKPGCFAFAGDHRVMTEAEVMAEFAPTSEETTQ